MIILKWFVCCNSDDKVLAGLLTRKVPSHLLNNCSKDSSTAVGPTDADFTNCHARIEISNNLKRSTENELASGDSSLRRYARLLAD